MRILCRRAAGSKHMLKTCVIRILHCRFNILLNKGSLDQRIRQLANPEPYGLIAIINIHPKIICHTFNMII